MSIRVMTMVWDSNIPAPERFTLLALADWGYEDGNRIYPSIKTLARKCALSERAVQSHIQKLEKLGVLVVSRFKEGEARRTNKYHIQVDVLRRMVAPEEPLEETPEPSDGCNICTHAGSAPVQDPTVMGAGSDSDGCRSCTPSVREPLEEPKEPPPTPPRVVQAHLDDVDFLITADAAIGGIEADFETWWAQWPRKIAKRKAFDSYRRARKRKVPAELLLATAAQQLATWTAAGRAHDKIPHATTWLNQERWNDAIEQPKFKVINNPQSPWDGIRIDNSDSPWAADMGWTS